MEAFTACALFLQYHQSIWCEATGDIPLHSSRQRVQFYQNQRSQNMWKRGIRFEKNLLELYSYSMSGQSWTLISAWNCPYVATVNGGSFAGLNFVVSTPWSFLLKCFCGALVGVLMLQRSLLSWKDFCNSLQNHESLAQQVFPVYGMYRMKISTPNTVYYRHTCIANLLSLINS